VQMHCTRIDTGNVEKYNVYVRFGNEMEKEFGTKTSLIFVESRPSSNTRADTEKCCTVQYCCHSQNDGVNRRDGG